MFSCFLSTSPLFAGFTHGKIPKTTSGWSSTACCSFCKHLAWTFGRPDRAVNAVNVWNPVPQKPWEMSLKTSTGWQECYRICQCLVSGLSGLCGLNWHLGVPVWDLRLLVSLDTKYSEIFWAITGWHDNPKIPEEWWRWIPRFQVISMIKSSQALSPNTQYIGCFGQDPLIPSSTPATASRTTSASLCGTSGWIPRKKYRIYRSFGVHASKTSMGGKRWKKALNYSTTNFRNFLGTYACKRVKHIHTCKNNPKDRFLWNSHSAHFWVSTHVEGGTHYCHFHVFSRDASLDVPISLAAPCQGCPAFYPATPEMKSTSQRCEVRTLWEISSTFIMLLDLGQLIFHESLWKMCWTNGGL